MEYMPKQKEYIDSVDGQAHLSAVNIIGELEAQIKDQNNKIGALVSNLMFALKYMKAKSGEPFMIQIGNDGKQKMVHIDDAFIESIEAVGILIDREKLANVRKEKL